MLLVNQYSQALVMTKFLAETNIVYLAGSAASASLIVELLNYPSQQTSQGVC